MAAKPTETSIIPAKNDLLITPNNGTGPSTDYWEHTKSSIAIEKSQKGGNVNKQILFISVYYNGRQTHLNIHYSRLT